LHVTKRVESVEVTKSGIEDSPRADTAVLEQASADPPPVRGNRKTKLRTGLNEIR
jgi:hypothetical protein